MGFSFTLAVLVLIGDRSHSKGLAAGVKTLSSKKLVLQSKDERVRVTFKDQVHLQQPP